MSATNNASAQDRAAEIARLAGLPEADYAAERGEAALRLGMTRADLEKAVKAQRLKDRAAREAATRAAPLSSSTVPSGSVWRSARLAPACPGACIRA